MVLVSKSIKCLDNLTLNLGKVELLVPTIVIDELNRIARSSNVKRAKNAMLALEVISNSKEFNVVDICKGYRASSSYDVDEMIVDYSSSTKCYVATIDNELIRKLRKRGIGVVTLRDDVVTIIH
jgi:rRNA-processing protein FCF1